jgi:hypothetical protein
MNEATFSLSCGGENNGVVVEGALFGRLFGDFGLMLVAGTIQLTQDAYVYFGNRDIDRGGFLSDSHFFLIRAMP